MTDTMQWRPIETAPKDGSEILLTNGRSVASGWWQTYHDKNEEQEPEWWDHGGGMLPEPTHWMPIPALPGNAE